jgi:lipopolysaccharide export system permease protein
MLKILDRYIVKQYLQTFFFVVLMFTLIACVIDFSEKVEDFARSAVTKKEVIVDYYFNFIPHINNLLFPLYALISVTFFTSRLAYNSEIISILNAGVSFTRLLRPYMLGAVIITALHFAMNHYIVPQGNKKRLAIENKYVWTRNDKGKTEHVHLFLDPETKIYIQFYRKPDTSARDFRLEKFKNGELVSVLKAENAKWKGYPNRWSLENVQEHTFNGMKETLRVLKTPLDTTLNVTPEDFVRFSNQNEMLNSFELKKEINKRIARSSGNTKSLEVEWSRRSAEPFTILILTLIGVSLAARKVRGGMGLHLAMAIGIGALYIFVSKFSMTFAASPMLPAAVGVWIPNFIFGMVALYLVSNAQR